MLRRSRLAAVSRREDDRHHKRHPAAGAEPRCGRRPPEGMGPVVHSRLASTAMWTCASPSTPHPQRPSGPPKAGTTLAGDVHARRDHVAGGSIRGRGRGGRRSREPSESPGEEYWKDEQAVSVITGARAASRGHARRFARTDMRSPSSTSTRPVARQSQVDGGRRTSTFATCPMPGPARRRGAQSSRTSALPTRSSPAGLIPAAEAIMDMDIDPRPHVEGQLQRHADAARLRSSDDPGSAGRSSRSAR